MNRASAECIDRSNAVSDMDLCVNVFAMECRASADCVDYLSCAQGCSP